MEVRGVLISCARYATSSFLRDSAASATWKALSTRSPSRSSSSWACERWSGSRGATRVPLLVEVWESAQTTLSRSIATIWIRNAYPR